MQDNASCGICTRWSCEIQGNTKKKKKKTPSRQSEEVTLGKQALLVAVVTHVTCYFALLVPYLNSSPFPILCLVILLLLSVRGALSHRPRHCRPSSQLLNSLLGLRLCVPHPRKLTASHVFHPPHESFRARFAAAGGAGGVARGEEGDKGGRGWW